MCDPEVEDRAHSLIDLSQGLANGFPLSGIVSRMEITEKLKPGIMVIQPLSKAHARENSNHGCLRVEHMREMPLPARLQLPALT